MSAQCPQPARPAAGQRHWYPLQGIPRQQCFLHLAGQAADTTAWLPAAGGLLGNLTLYENLRLASPRVCDPAHWQQALQQHWQEAGGEASDLAGWLGQIADTCDEQDRLLALMLRTLLAQPALILVQSEWFSLLTAALQSHWLQWSTRHLPHAAWLALGSMPPPSAWGFVHGELAASCAPLAATPY